MPGILESSLMTVWLLISKLPPFVNLPFTISRISLAFGSSSPLILRKLLSMLYYVQKLTTVILHFLDYPSVCLYFSSPLTTLLLDLSQWRRSIGSYYRDFGYLLNNVLPSTYKAPEYIPSLLEPYVRIAFNLQGSRVYSVIVRTICTCSYS